MLKEGLSLNDVRLLLGHASIRTTLRYQHLESNDVSPEGRGDSESAERREESGEDEGSVADDIWDTHRFPAISRWNSMGVLTYPCDTR